MSDSTEICIENGLTRRKRNNDTSCLDDGLSDFLSIPDLAMEKIFSFLSVEDLQNVRLVSSRLSGEVLKLEKRFRTWKIEIGNCQSAQPDTDKVSQYKIMLHVQMDLLREIYLDDSDIDNSNLEEIDQEELDKLDAWLIKHSSYITGLKIKNVPKKLVTLLSRLKQVRRLEFENDPKLEFLRFQDEMDALLSILTIFGTELESLNVKLWARWIDFCYSNEFDSSCFSLSNLKHVDLDCENVITSSILQILPASLESLSLSVAEDFELPPTINQMNKLKQLKVGTAIYDDNYYDVKMSNLTTMLLSTSLTRLQLQNIDLRDQELVDKDFPSLKFLHLDCCNIGISLLKKLLMMSAESLKELVLKSLDVENYEDFDISLPVVTTLDLDNCKGVSCWLPQLIFMCSTSLTTLKLSNFCSGSQVQLDSDLPVLTTLELDCVSKISCFQELLSKCSETLTTLKLSFVDECELDHLDSDLHVLKDLTIRTSRVDINNFLSKCSSSLQILRMSFMLSVKFEVNAPNLVELQLYNIRADGFTNLVSPHGSRIETIGLKEVSGSVWEDIVRCRFEYLRILYLPLEEDNYWCEPMSLYEEHLEALKTSIITTDVKVIKDWNTWTRHVRHYFDVDY